MLYTSVLHPHYPETGTLMPQFRWKRSQWSRYCPVELTKGNMVLGSMKLAVA